MSLLSLSNDQHLPMDAGLHFQRHMFLQERGDRVWYAHDGLRLQSGLAHEPPDRPAVLLWRRYTALRFCSQPEASALALATRRHDTTRRSEAEPR